ncbi:hypothetical protein BJY01DRAFT_246915 [Aspergillus pseudoustus]|uniref:Uncharacterized protein n=1 Tax=Aspergillus pseudoustus TaxID=1810923 RepID=A0ABR4K491_9EURO
MAPISTLTTTFPPLLLFLFLFLFPTTSLARECYLMSGKPAPSDYTPCNASLPESSSSTHSPCCASDSSVCLSSGLCLSSNGLIYENGCTDATWESPDCPHVCPDASTAWRGKGSGGNWEDGKKRDYWQVMGCSAGVVCRRATGEDEGCCGDDTLAVQFTPGLPVATGAGTASATPSSDGVASEGTDTANCAKRERTIGAAVGASLGAALVGALGAVWFLLHRQKKLAATLGEYRAAEAQGPGIDGGFSHAPPRQLSRNSPFTPFAELSGQRKYELSTESSVSPSTAPS